METSCYDSVITSCCCLTDIRAHLTSKAATDLFSTKPKLDCTALPPAEWACLYQSIADSHNESSHHLISIIKHWAVMGRRWGDEVQTVAEKKTKKKSQNRSWGSTAYCGTCVSRKRVEGLGSPNGDWEPRSSWAPHGQPSKARCEGMGSSGEQKGDVTPSQHPCPATGAATIPLPGSTVWVRGRGKYSQMGNASLPADFWHIWLSPLGGLLFCVLLFLLQLCLVLT